MKKLLSIIIFLFCAFISYAQLPNNQSVSNNQTRYHIPNMKADSSIMYPIKDTLNNPATFYPGAMTIRPQDTIGHVVFPIYQSNGIYWTKVSSSVIILPPGVDSGTVNIAGNQICFWQGGIPTCYFLTPSTGGAVDSFHLNFDSTWILHFRNGTQLGDSIFLFHTYLYADGVHLTLTSYLPPFGQLINAYQLLDSAYASPFSNGFNYFRYANGQIDSLSGGGSSTVTINWSVRDSLSTPPISPSDGDKYLVGTSPTGLFVGHANEIATYNLAGLNYTFQSATTGDLLYNAGNTVVSQKTVSTWIRVSKLLWHQGGEDASYGNVVGGSKGNFSTSLKTNDTTRLNISNTGVSKFSNGIVNGNYINLDPAYAGLKPKIDFFFAGASQITIGASDLNAADFNVNKSLEVDGRLRSRGIVNGSTLANIYTTTAPGGSISLMPTSDDPFINFTQSGAYFAGALGTRAATGDLVYTRTPSNNVSFDGTEVFRIKRASGDFNINSPTEDTSAILNVYSKSKGVLFTPMTAVQRLAINSRASLGNISAAGTGYTPGTYTAVALTTLSGSGTGATATITVNGSGQVTAVNIVHGGTGGYAIGNTLSSASIGGGSGFVFTLSAITMAATGLMVFDTDSLCYFNYTGSAWVSLCRTGSGGSTPTLQQIFDVQSANALLNKDDTITTNSHTLFIGDAFGGQLNGLEFDPNSAVMGAGYSSSGNNAKVNFSADGSGSSFQIQTNNIVGGSKSASIFAITDPTTSQLSVEADSFQIKSTLSGATNGMVWTLANSALGTGYWATGGSGGNTIYTGDGNLAGNRTVDLNGNNLIFSDIGGLQVVFTPGDGVFGAVTPLGKRLSVSDDGDRALMEYDGTHKIEINSTGTTVTGSILYDSPPIGASTDSILTWNATTKVVNKRTVSSFGIGTVTSVAALTLGTTGTDLTSSVANSTTTPVITLNVPTASASNRGALSSTDWSTFNSKQGTISVTSPITLTGASVGMVNQGTTTTVLHGNASGNPSFGAIVNADITNATIDLTTKPTGVLPIANGGTNASSASITAFNNITGYTAAGATGTTSTNLVFSTSPTLITPTLGVASATSLSLTGTGGAGFLQVANQSSAPSTPTTSGRLYFDNSNRFSWIGTNGFTRTFDGTANTANRIYVLPDAAGTVALTSDLGSYLPLTGGILTLPVTTGTGTTAGLQATANSLTTGNGIDVSSSSITTGNLMKLTSTSTVGNGFSLSNINSSGANGTASKTVTGETISVTNTGTTSTNVGLDITVSGATTNNALRLTGNIIFPTDATYNIGASGANRPSNIFAAGNIQAGGALVAAAGNEIYFLNRTVFASPSDGVLKITNFGGTDFGRIQLGGTTSSFPAIARSGANILIKDASDGVASSLGIGVTTATARVHIGAGTATASTAPLKFTTGTLLTTPEAGVIEFLTDGYYVTTTTGAKRRFLAAATAGRATAQTAANASVATYTLGASDASYEVSANVLVTTSSAEAFTVTCAYTDESNTARTQTMPFVLLAGTTAAAINFAQGAVPYEGIPIHIRVKASTAITIATVGTFTGATYNVEGIIKQTQ